MIRCSENYRRMSCINKSSALAGYPRPGDVEFERSISGANSRVVGSCDADSDIVINLSWLRTRKPWCTDIDDLRTTATIGIDSTLVCSVIDERNNLSQRRSTTRLYCGKITVETNAVVVTTLPSEIPRQ